MIHVVCILCIRISIINDVKCGSHFKNCDKPVLVLKIKNTLILKNILTSVPCNSYYKKKKSKGGEVFKEKRKLSLLEGVLWIRQRRILHSGGQQVLHSHDVFQC